MIWQNYLNKNYLLPLLAGIFIATLSFHSFATATWQELAPGIEYQEFKGKFFTSWSHIYVFRIDLAKNQLGSVSAKSMGIKSATTRQFALYSKALISINGGFFDREFNSLGLRISNKKLKHPLKNISWWPIFYVKNHKPYIANMSSFNQNAEIDFAIQSGPRLINKGIIPSLKLGIAERTALGITDQGKVIILVSTHSPMSTYETAQILSSPPLSCTDAINLDGGKSSQLFAHINSFYLNIQGFTQVSDAVVVKNN